jgi:hypothetical protein
MDGFYFSIFADQHAGWKAEDRQQIEQLGTWIQKDGKSQPIRIHEGCRRVPGITGVHGEQHKAIAMTPIKVWFAFNPAT